MKGSRKMWADRSCQFMYRSWPGGNAAERLVVVVNGQADLLEVVDAVDPPRRLRADWTAGSKSAIKTPMIAITTKSSISVNPRPRTAFMVPRRAGSTGWLTHRSSRRGLCPHCRGSAVSEKLEVDFESSIFIPQVRFQPRRNSGTDSLRV